MQQIFHEKKKKQMSEAVFVRFTAHSNMEGPHESFRVCHFFKLWTEIAFLPLISLSYSFSLTASKKGKKKKKTGWSCSNLRRGSSALNPK